MARPTLTETAWRANVNAKHLPAMAAAMRTLSKPLADDYVCDCDEGNAEGITSRECGCEHRESARVLEAGGCYIRRGLANGWAL